MRNAALHEEVRKEQLGIIIATLRSNGIKTVTVTFDGSGDSGQIEGAEFQPECTEQAKHTPLQWRETSDRYEKGTDGNWDYATDEQSRNGRLEDLIETAVYRLLEHKHGGWEINEGSFGRFTFDAEKGTVAVEFNQRVESYETENYTVE